MPELPEVETIRRDLSRVLPGKKLARLEVAKSKMVRGSVRTLRRRLVGQVVGQIERRGKLLIIHFKDQDVHLLIHLKMTGQLIYRDGRRLLGGGHSDRVLLRGDDLPHRYSHIIFTFTGGAQLFFNDMRQFGYARLVTGAQLERVLAGYGVEPLTRAFTVAVLGQALRRRKTALKNALLDQRQVAGLGNIYVDESTFYAGIRPTRRADRLTRAEVVRLHKEIKRVLTRAVAKRGTTFGNYRDGLGGEGNFVKLLKVYGRAGRLCLRCKIGVIKKTKVNGRGTSFCPVCQR